MQSILYDAYCVLQSPRLSRAVGSDKLPGGLWEPAHTNGPSAHLSLPCPGRHSIQSGASTAKDVSGLHSQIQMQRNKQMQTVKVILLILLSLCTRRPLRHSRWCHSQIKLRKNQQICKTLGCELTCTARRVAQQRYKSKRMDAECFWLLCIIRDLSYKQRGDDVSVCRARVQQAQWGSGQSRKHYYYLRYQHSIKSTPWQWC